MRREADDIGPRAELEHWKKRMSKFNYLVDQIKGQQVKAVLGILHTAKSKLIKVLAAFVVGVSWDFFLCEIYHNNDKNNNNYKKRLKKGCFLHSKLSPRSSLLFTDTIQTSLTNSKAQSQGGKEGQHAHQTASHP